jgi:hypothetical protein
MSDREIKALPTALDSARVWGPDVFVQLQLHPHWKAVLKNPVRKIGRGQSAKHWAHQNRFDPLRKLMVAYHFTGPIEIPSVTDDKFDLVALREILQVRQPIVAAFATGRTFQIHYFDHARVDQTQVSLTGSFDQDGKASVQQQAEQAVDPFLK